MGIAAAVGPHRELPPGPAVAYPSYRLAQEVGGAPDSVGAALTQPRHQHIAGAGPSSPGPGQQRVIATRSGVAMVSRSFLGQTVASLCPYPGRAEETNWCGRVRVRMLMARRVVRTKTE